MGSPSGLQDLAQLARHAASLGEHERARGLFEAAINEVPSEPHLLADFAAHLMAGYDFVTVGPILDRLASLPLTDTSPLIQAAQALAGAGRVSESARFLERALAHHPGDLNLVVGLSEAYENTGRFELARDLATQALALEATHSQATRLLARLELREGDGNAARVRLIRHLQQDTGGDDWGLRHELATVFDRLDEPQAAMRELSKAKACLYPQARASLERAKQIRARQWELTSRTTAADWSRWATDATREPSQHPIVFVAGFPRSGASLFESILGNHPHCQAMGCSGILASQFTRPLAQQIATAEDAFAFLNRHNPESLAAAREHYLRCAAAFLGKSVEGRLLLDREPFLTADLPLPLRLFPEAKVLMILRDPRDAVLSFYFSQLRLGPDSAPSIDLGEACRHYSDTMRHWLHLAPILPHPSLSGRYEDLITDPVATIRKLCSFIGLEWSPALLEGQTLEGRSINRWHAYEAWLAPHLHHLAPFIEAFGYRR